MIEPAPTILVVEDDEMIQAFLDCHLENEGYKVQAAANGAEMFLALATGRPDLILLDINLPDGDGLGFIRQIRDRSNAPIIIATARKGREDRLEALRLGADDYLTKPFDPRELILRVRNILNRHLDEAAVPENRLNKYVTGWKVSSYTKDRR